jgi:hypothetical protein
VDGVIIQPSHETHTATSPGSARRRHTGALAGRREPPNRTNPLNHDTDGDGTWDGAEVAQGGNPNNPGDGGNPPADPVEEVEFTVGGDYATWRMEIKATGPRDNRTLN